MAEANANPPIIIVKKKAAHGGHHGGAWKVAYADFVTAMMALFIVLWLLSTSEKVKKAVAEYFVDPQGKKKLVGSGLVGSGESMAFSKEDLEKLKKKLEESLAKVPDFSKLKDLVTMTITGEGLRIELMENPKGMFFELGKPKPTAIGVEVISVLAQQLGKLPNHLVVEGHTDAAPYQQVREYSNWELSSDRANIARKIMQDHGVRDDQVKQVRGFADQNLRKPQNPFDASNRRISVIVQYQNVDANGGVEFSPASKSAQGAMEKAHATKEEKPKA
ncbi:MAG: OmpA family protein [Acidobacteriaceae bacterium]|nr:OmpA family protein [Acidobacteriaceae bacterium]